MKGISPLLAAVLLIGITVSLSIIIKDWVVSYVHEELYKIERNYAATMECLKSSFRVITYTLDGNILHMTLENTGEYDLYDFRIIYLKEGNQVTSSLNLTLEKGGIKYISVDLIFIPKKIRILARSDACALVYYDLV